jgi:PD-(D/E)XK nuclease superfamily
VSDAAEMFNVGVRDSDGRWPAPPRTWSYSSLRDATECPRRWMLRRATYPGLWDQRGYPPRPGIMPLAGDIVHGAVEAVLIALRAHGCVSSADPAAVAVLKGLGGYTSLVEHGIETVLAALAGNPRARGKTGALKAALQVKVPEMRQRVQSIITRTPVSLAGEDLSAASPAARGPLPAGSYPEAVLQAPDLRLAGRADLLTITADGCEIADYKTGAPDPRHADQVRLYALIWSRDSILNPAGLPARRLILSYASHDEEVQPPSAGEVDALAEAATAQIKAAETALRHRPPPARPSAANCELCEVRQLCTDYWEFLAASPANSVQPEGWLDFEGTAIRQNGPRSWVLADQSDGSELLVRTLGEDVPFTAGDRLRILGLRRGDGSESPMPAVTMTQASEIFVMDSPARAHR